MTASTCEQLCLGCSRCQYVSFNGRDCNWFAECDLAQLEESDGRSGWHTTRVRGEGSSDIVHNGTLLRNHTVVPTRSPCLHDRCASVAPSVSVFVVLDASARTVLANQKCEGFVKNLVRSACSQWDRPSPLLRPLMLDIGANSGYYSFVGAALGCRVVAFEPQRGCHQRIAAATQLNADLASDVHFLQAAVVPRSGRRVVRVPIVKEWSSGRREWREGCSVTSSSHRLAAPLDQRLPQRHHSQQKEERVQTASVREALVARGMHGPGDAIALAKVDAEGGELGVLRSMIEDGSLMAIQNLVIETSPFWWPARQNQSKEEGARLFATLLTQHGFVLAVTPARVYISTGNELADYILRMQGEHQEDLWFARDATFARLHPTGVSNRRGCKS